MDSIIRAGRGSAVVTGASSGIGAATARRLADEGYHVIAVARRSRRLADLVAEIGAAGGSARAVTGDITTEAVAGSLLAAVAESGSPLTVLVNNAGGAIGLEPVAVADLAAWRRMYEVNVLGTARVTQALLPRLIDSGAGVVVVIGSTAGLDVYDAGVAEPLVAADIADAVAWCVTRPAHVNIDRLVIRPAAQASNHKVHRG